MTSSREHAGRFVWHDFFAHDVESAASFYSDLLGIQTERASHGGHDFRQWRCGDRPCGNLLPLTDEESSPHWLPYVAVDDVETCLARAAELKGQVHVASTEVPGVGRIAVLRDLHGALLGLFAGEVPVVGEVAQAPCQGMVCWNELWAPDSAMAAMFYDSLFGWEQEARDMGDFYYHVQRLGEQQVGGIMSPRAPIRPQWCPYFFVDDVDAAHEKAMALGAAATLAPMDVVNVGRFSTCSDPQGACFALLGPSR